MCAQFLEEFLRFRLTKRFDNKARNDQNLKVNESRSRQYGVTPHFPKHKKQMPTFWYGGSAITTDNDSR